MNAASPKLLVSVLSLMVGLAACTALTEPPTPDTIVSDPSNAQQPKAAASARPEARPAPTPTPTPTPAPTPAAPAVPEKPLQKIDLLVGKGPEAKTNDNVSVHYTGTLENGEKFDSSKDRNQPFEFKLGQGRVIPGWDQGVPGMKVGGKRKLIIPPSLGYGARGAGAKIPPNSVLVFEIELLGIKP